MFGLSFGLGFGLAGFHPEDLIFGSLNMMNIMGQLVWPLFLQLYKKFVGDDSGNCYLYHVAY